MTTPKRAAAPTAEGFVELCKALRLLGATEVTHGDLHAKFEGRLRAVVVTPDAEPATREPEPEPQLTEEQAIEAQYRRELGRAAPATK